MLIAPKPAKITKFDESAVTQLNTDLENLWNLSNGRYINDIIISVPTKNQKKALHKFIHLVVFIESIYI